MLKIPFVAAFCVGSFIASPAQADVVLFDFTGVVSTSALSGGTVQALESSSLSSSWIGQLVSGTIRMDLGAAGHQQYFPELGMSQVSTTSEFPNADWMQTTVHQPDGSTVVIASGPAPDPYPIFEGNDAYSDIRNSTDVDEFYVQRTFSNAVTYPQQFFSIDLSSRFGGLGLTDSSDYRNVHFDVGQANYSNAGSLTKLDAAGVGYQYGFQVLSLNQSVVAVVPEPGTWLLMVLGIALLLSGSKLIRQRAAELPATLPMS